MKFFKVPLRQNTFMPPLLRSIIHNNPQDPTLYCVQCKHIILYLYIDVLLQNINSM